MASSNLYLLIPLGIPSTGNAAKMRICSVAFGQYLIKLVV